MNVYGIQNLNFVTEVTNVFATPRMDLSSCKEKLVCTCKYPINQY